MSVELLGDHLGLISRGGTSLFVGVLDGLLDTPPFILTPEVFNPLLNPLDEVSELILVVPGVPLLEQVPVGQPALPLDSRQLPLQRWVPLHALALLEVAGVFVATFGLQDLILEGPKSGVDDPHRKFAR